ncbi:hypothetical protein AB0F43_37420 [Kribbella sp. NPDC023972]|uniref:hypothetical protein n=1 Tax=Kribbella sp. NPDC023972 TaxID=3154795 RepID=UPI0033D99976
MGKEPSSTAGSPTSLAAAGPTAILALVASMGRRADRGLEKRQQQIAELQKEMKDLRAVRVLATDLEEALAKDTPSSALLAIERGKDARAFLKATSPEDADRLDEFSAGLEPRVDEIMADLPRTFPSELDALDVALDPSSRHPKYTVERQFITIQVDEKKRQAIVQTRGAKKEGAKKEKVAVDPAVLAQHVADEWKRCFARETDLPQFAERLRAAVAKKARGVGARLPIKELIEELRVTDKGFAVDEFAVDLARLVASGADVVVEARGLRLDHTKNDADGVLLPGLEDRGYYGYVSFDAQGVT